MNQDFQIRVAIDERTAESEFEEFLQDLRAAGVQTDLKKFQNAGPYNTFDLLIPTAVALLIARPYIEMFVKPYVDGYLKEAGKHHYELTKSAISKLWSKFFGKKPTVIRTVVTRQGVIESDFSRAVSLSARRVDGGEIILLFSKNSSQEDFDVATQKFCELLAKHYTAGEGDALMKTIYSTPFFAPNFKALVRLNPSTKELEVIDYVSGSQKNEFVTIGLND